MAAYYKLLFFLLYYSKLTACSDVSHSNSKPQQQYCSFFNNRAPSSQPGLRNCTWFKENSCCLQQEIEVTFGKVKPLKGASVLCQKYINYLMCYICAPTQNIFYQNERLTVCEDFCNQFYQACNTAILKGSPIKYLYSNGKEFCLSRRFLVDSGSCFDFDPSLDTSTSSHCEINLFLISVLLFLSLICPNIYSENGVVKEANTGVLRKKDGNCNHKNNTKASVREVAFKKCQMTQILRFCLVSVIVAILQNVRSVHARTNLMPLEERNVKVWSKLIAEDFIALAKEGLQYENLENIMQNAEYVVENVNSTKNLLDIRQKLVTFFSDKQEMAKNISNQVQRLHDNWRPEYSNVTHLQDLPMNVYKDADLINRLPLKNFKYSKKFKSDVLWNSSVVKVPDGVSRHDSKVLELVQWSAELDLLFMENMKSDPDIRWQYFGSSIGIHRSFPGREWGRNFIGFTEDFDPRSRPWYLSAVSGPKDVVIVIDASLSMKQDNRLFRMKEVVYLILDTLTKQDRVNIVLSRSSHWNRKGQEIIFHPKVVSCKKSGLVQATASNRRELWAAVKSISAKGGSEHTQAFNMTFSLLKHGDNLGDSQTCQRVIIFITDGDLRDANNRCSKGYYKYYHDGTKEFVSGKVCEHEQKNLQREVTELQKMLSTKANIITVVVDKGIVNRVETSLGRLACSNNGVMVKVQDSYNIFESMKPYFEFLQQTTRAYTSLWTSPYLDKSGLGLMMTVSVPVYSKNNKGLLGVVGIDVPLEKIETILKHSNWGEIYAFMVDRNDLTAVIHPFAKPTAQLESDPIFVPVVDLETHNGKPRDFVKVLLGVLEADTGEVMVTEDAIRPVSTEEANWWKEVEYTHYVYTDIPDSDFSIVLNVGRSDEYGYHRKMEPAWNGRVSYLSDMDQYRELGMNDIYNELSPSSTVDKYKGIHVTTTHSVVHLAPQAFCDPQAYLYGHPSFRDIDEFINNHGDGSIGACGKDGRIYHSDVRPEVKLTEPMESFWINRNPDLQKQILWTYIGTANGVMRMYPGVRIRRDYDPTSRLWYTRTQANNQLDLSISKVYTDVIPTLGKVVTLSKPIHRPTSTQTNHCKESNKEDGCPCVSDSDCLSHHCSAGSCISNAVQAVVAMDIMYQDFHRRILELVNRNIPGKEKFCGSEYECEATGVKCKTRCYLVTDTAHFSYADDFHSNTTTNHIDYESSTLASVQGHIFKKLLQEGVFIRNYRLDYQGVCERSQENKMVNVFSSSSFHSEYDSDRGPIPHFQDKYSCIKEAVYYNANATILNNHSYILKGDLHNDPCSQGIFYFVTVPGLNLFLLVIEDYHHHGDIDINCHISNSVLRPGSVKLDYEVCPNRKSLVNITGSRSCHYQGHISLPCGWSQATRHFQQYQTSFLTIFCILLLAQLNL